MVYNFFLKFRKIFIFNSLGIKKEKGFIKFEDKKCDVLNSNEGFLFLFIYLFIFKFRNEKCTSWLHANFWDKNKKCSYFL